MGILRMLASGSTSAFDELLPILGQDKLKTMELLKKMFLVDKNEARRLLSSYTPDQRSIERILALVYEAKRPAHILIDTNSLMPIQLENKLMSWDFKKASFWNLYITHKNADFLRLAEKRFGYSLREVEKNAILMRFFNSETVWDWITEGAWRFTNFGNNIEKRIGSGSTVLFDNAMVADLDRMKIYGYGIVTKRWILPSYIVYYDRSNGEMKEYTDNDSNHAHAAFILRQDKTTYKGMLLSRPFAESLFFKLFFMNGAGLNHFKLLYHQHSRAQDKDFYLYEVKMN
ncbi:MAG: hypothetical protein NC923_00950 [Candidatus Omnitrophica bacterium]|nr:hypothetical protein [Candidatus Omnitrophota bacterium]